MAPVTAAVLAQGEAFFM
jgi:hypothetical protein